MSVLQEHLVVGVARARAERREPGRPELAGRRRRHRPRRIDHDRAPLRPRFRRHHDGQKVERADALGPRSRHGRVARSGLGQKRPARVGSGARNARGPVGRRHKRAGVPRVLLRLGQRDARRQVAELPERHDIGTVEARGLVWLIDVDGNSPYSVSVRRSVEESAADSAASVWLCTVSAHVLPHATVGGSDPRGCGGSFRTIPWWHDATSGAAVTSARLAASSDPRVGLFQSLRFRPPASSTLWSGAAQICCRFLSPSVK